MADQSGPINQETVSGVVIDPASNNPISVTQTSTLQTVNTGGVGEDGFEVSVNLTGADVAEKVNIAVVLDQSGSTRNDSGTDFNGNGQTDSILVGELFAALELFDAYVASGYDPVDLSISLITYSNTAQVRGTFGLDERDAFVQALEDVSDEGPQFSTNFVAGLDAVGTAWSDAGVDPDDTNVVVFLSDGFPVPRNQDISGSADDLENDWGAAISGIGLGENSSLNALNQLDNTGVGATQVLSGQELLDEIVTPLTEADFLRFEITVSGVDMDGNPVEQVIVLPESDPNVITTQLGWSVDCLPLDPVFAAPQDIEVTFRGYFAEDPGNPGSGEQVVTTVHQIALVVCFTPGTLIMTPGGAVDVAALVAGDRVVTRDHGVQTVRWTGSTTVPASHVAARPSLRPILIRKGALGPDLPQADLRVSRQHRILVRDWRSEMMFGVEGGVLVPAFTLCNDSTIIEERPDGPVTYIHIAFDNHEVVYAEGVETESFQPALRTVSAMNQAQRTELMGLFPQLADRGTAYVAARNQPRNQDAHVLAPR